MITKWLISLLVITSLLAPALASANGQSASSSPIERFAKSMVTVYIAAEMCKNVPTLHSENYVVVIKNYLQAYFQDKAPYWVLPVVEKRINDRASCMNFIEQDIARYRADSKVYVEDYPEGPKPPQLNYAMLDDTRSYANAYNGSSTKDHFLTPTVLVK